MLSLKCESFKIYPKNFIVLLYGLTTFALFIKLTMFWIYKVFFPFPKMIKVLILAKLEVLGEYLVGR